MAKYYTTVWAEITDQYQALHGINLNLVYIPTKITNHLIRGVARELSTVEIACDMIKLHLDFEDKKALQAFK